MGFRFNFTTSCATRSRIYLLGYVLPSTQLYAVWRLTPNTPAISNTVYPCRTHNLPSSLPRWVDSGITKSRIVFLGTLFLRSAGGQTLLHPLVLIMLRHHPKHPALRPDSFWGEFHPSLTPCVWVLRQEEHHPPHHLLLQA